MNEQTVSVPTNALQEIADDQFTMAVHQAAQILDRPEFNGRLEKAVELVLAGGVELHEDGTATVKSGNRKYYLEPDCTCEDSKRHSLYCKHFLAVRVLKRTYERIGQSSNGHTTNGNGHHPEPQDTSPQQESTQPSTWGCAQAPSSCTLKWAVGGIELMLTLRDGTDDALFSRIQRVLPKIEQRMELQRQEREARQAAKTNDGGSSATTSNAPAGNGGEWCEYHDAPLKRFSKDGQVWYSHKTDDGKWCRGK